MTPKEKATELVNRFSKVGLQQREEGIECALICVNETIEYLEQIDAMITNSPHQKYFWIQVKAEIEKP